MCKLWVCEIMSPDTIGQSIYASQTYVNLKTTAGHRLCKRARHRLRPHGWLKKCSDISRGEPVLVLSFSFILTFPSALKMGLNKLSCCFICRAAMNHCPSYFSRQLEDACHRVSQEIMYFSSVPHSSKSIRFIIRWQSCGKCTLFNALFLSSSS